ncbi:MAG TPA: tetratricopeptide repeat protein [Thermoanaerobaculia bacterium]|jgi:TPR repeat protein|nr:tetratricopeptide repeat protein [Thermoanaerobaculia bacterium]
MFRPLVVTLLLSLPLAQVPASAWTPEEIQKLRADAESGDARAQYVLGKMLEKDDHKEEAVRWYRKAAEQGLRNAQTSLGFFYLNGEGGVAKDEAEAARWYRKAADQGEQLAQWQLAWMYQEGRGVPANEDEAVKWYETVIAAEAAETKPGEGTPMADMAKPQVAMIYSRRSMVYETGFGVPEDPAFGYYWLSRAAQLDPEIHAASLTSRARNLSAEQRAEAERRILEWSTTSGHGGPEGFAPALAALHAAAKIPQVPDPKKDH